MKPGFIIIYFIVLTQDKGVEISKHTLSPDLYITKGEMDVSTASCDSHGITLGKLIAALREGKKIH
jgi:hypothetical protein